MARGKYLHTLGIIDSQHILVVKPDHLLCN